jgi:hypothetical protein
VQSSSLHSSSRHTVVATMAHSPPRTVAMAALQTIVRCMQCVCSPVSVAASIAVAKHLLAVLNRAALLVYSCLSMVVVALAAVTGWCGAKELGQRIHQAQVFIRP